MRGLGVVVDDIDEVLADIGNLLAGGLDADNIKAGYLLPLASFLEQKSIVTFVGEVGPAGTGCVLGVVPASVGTLIPVRATAALVYTAAPSVLTVDVQMANGAGGWTSLLVTTMSAGRAKTIPVIGGNAQAGLAATSAFALASLTTGRVLRATVAGGTASARSHIALACKVTHL